MTPRNRRDGEEANQRGQSADIETLARPEALTLAQFDFCLVYLANGFNASAAYKAAYPKVGAATAATNGHRLLRNADVAAFLGSELRIRWRGQKMTAEEALARLAQQARADVRMLFDRRGTLLPPHRWPNEIACCVRSIHRGKNGTKVTLVDSSAPLRAILEHAGKVKQNDNGVSALALAIQKDLAKSEEFWAAEAAKQKAARSNPQTS